MQFAIASRAPVLLLTLALAQPASAAIVSLGVDPVRVTVTSTAMNSRYRLSQTNWDQMIATSTLISGATIVQQQLLGNAYTLNGRAWDFTMDYTAGRGYVFTLADTTVPPLGVSPSTVGWIAPFGGISATRSFNTIELFAQAKNTLQTGVTAQSIELSDLSFSGAGLGTTGSLANMLDTHLLSPTNGQDFARQWLVADTDLSLFNWTLSGTVQAWFSGTVPHNFDKQLKFDLRTVQASVVPLPPAVALLGAGIAVLGWTARRCEATRG